MFEQLQLEPAIDRPGLVPAGITKKQAFGAGSVFSGVTQCASGRGFRGLTF